MNVFLSSSLSHEGCFKQKKRTLMEKANLNQFAFIFLYIFATKYYLDEAKE